MLSQAKTILDLANSLDSKLTRALKSKLNTHQGVLKALVVEIAWYYFTRCTVTCL